MLNRTDPNLGSNYGENCQRSPLTCVRVNLPFRIRPCRSSSICSSFSCITSYAPASVIWTRPLPSFTGPSYVRNLRGWSKIFAASEGLSISAGFLSRRHVKRVLPDSSIRSQCTLPAVECSCITNFLVCAFNFPALQGFFQNLRLPATLCILTWFDQILKRIAQRCKYQLTEEGLRFWRV